MDGVGHSCHWCHQDGANSSLDLTRMANCPTCNRPVILVNVTKAASIVGVSTRTIFQWIEKGWVSTVRTSSGRQLVCRSSLFDRNTRETARRS